MSQHTTITIEVVPPHNGKPITKIAISPQSRYVVTYSQEDKSFVGWCNSKNTRKENSIAKCINNHPLIGFLFDVSDYDVSDYKVSDDKIIIMWKKFSFSVAIIYDMKNKQEIHLNSSLKKYADDKYEFYLPDYKFTNFLTSGDLATYYIIESKGSKNQMIRSVLLIYPSNTKDNNWECKYTYEIDNMNAIEISCGGITNDRLWTLSLLKNTIFDLLTFPISEEKIEKEINTKMVELKFLKSVMVISIEDIHYIYSNRMDFPIKIIEGSNSINNLIKSCLEINNNLNYFNNILFRLNDQKAFGIFHEKPWVINMKKCDLETYIINDKYIDSEEISDIKDSNNENILYKIGNQYTTTPDENELIKKYIIPNLVNSNENQNEYYMRLTFKNGEFILEAFINNSFQNRPSYKIRYSNWKYIIDNNTHILYDDTELHIYTFNIESKKIELQLCYNIKFLKYAIKLYNNNNEPDALEIDEIKEIAQPTNNELKKQWILYATNQKYFLVYYGEKLLKSAIKQHNIELIKLIYTKTLKYFKENPNNNIQFLAYYEEKLLKSENKELIELIYTETLKYFKENPNNNIQFLVYYEKFLKQQNKELMELIYTETLKCFKENKENPNINIQFLAYYGEKLLKSENKDIL
uniref:Uncharacterized protein n=1 Tax=Rhizophagus irregularis (strain DAOM 181602 / DAOM 197198 / MUCL 43194) TaxID=747089 RepID=U9UC18_RHIID